MWGDKPTTPLELRPEEVKLNPSSESGMPIEEGLPGYPASIIGHKEAHCRRDVVDCTEGAHQDHGEVAGFAGRARRIVLAE